MLKIKRKVDDARGYILIDAGLLLAMEKHNRLLFLINLPKILCAHNILSVGLQFAHVTFMTHPNFTNPTYSYPLINTKVKLLMAVDGTLIQQYKFI